MRLTIIAVGRIRRCAAGTLFEEYQARLSWRLGVREIEVQGKLSASERRAREGVRVLDAVPRGAVVVALDESGTMLSSAALAERLRAWQEAGKSDIVFLIGGAEGHARAVRERAALVLSLGPMTWPHFLVRGMLAEQLYRAETILSGHPYHRS